MPESRLRKRRGLVGLASCSALLLASCGDGGGSSPTPTPAPTTGPTTPPTTASTSTAECSLSARKDWVRAQANEWYLFPDLLATGTNAALYSDVQSYIDALVAPARAQNRDRYFTYITSIAEEDAYYADGANIGFGFRLAINSGQLMVAEVFENSPVSRTDITRGATILTVGTTASNQTSVASLINAGNYDALNDAFYPATAGRPLVMLVRYADGRERTVSLSSAEFDIDPVSDSFGTKIFTEGTRRIGYVALRSFITPAESDLKAAFAQFKAQGVTELIIDLRYNGGGLLSTAEVFGDLLGGGRSGQVFQRLMLRDSKSAQNDVSNFAPGAESIAPTKIAFIGTGSTASASELLMNAMAPYLGTNMALIGQNTYGKPVGQIAFDRPACDDRLRLLAFRNTNANGDGDYYNGLAGTLPVTCRASDDLTHELGDQQEGMIATALDFLAGRSCSAISGSAMARSARSAEPQTEMLRSGERGTTAQREMPGLF